MSPPYSTDSSRADKFVACTPRSPATKSSAPWINLFATTIRQHPPSCCPRTTPPTTNPPYTTATTSTCPLPLPKPPPYPTPPPRTPRAACEAAPAQPRARDEARPLPLGLLSQYLGYNVLRLVSKLPLALPVEHDRLCREGATPARAPGNLRISVTHCTAPGRRLCFHQLMQVL